MTHAHIHPHHRRGPAAALASAWDALCCLPATPPSAEPAGSCRWLDGALPQFRIGHLPWMRPPPGAQRSAGLRHALGSILSDPFQARDKRIFGVLPAGRLGAGDGGRRVGSRTGVRCQRASALSSGHSKFSTANRDHDLHRRRGRARDRPGHRRARETKNDATLRPHR